MTSPEPASKSRIEREVEREREQRHKNDEARAGILADDEFRIKDARENTHSGSAQHRVRGH